MKLDEMIFREEERKDRQINSGLTEVRSAVESDSLICASLKSGVKCILSWCESDISSSLHLVDIMKEDCFRIRKNVETGKLDNYAINLNQGLQIFNKQVIELENCVVKIKIFHNYNPLWLSYKKGDLINVVFFIGDDGKCYMVVGDDESNVYYIKILEFYLLSTISNDDETESGWITSYSWWLGKVFSSEILGYSLDPVKSLLLSEWFNEKRKELELSEGKDNE